MNFFTARDAFNSHFDGCRNCGVGGRLCAAGTRLHDTYVRLRRLLEGGR